MSRDIVWTSKFKKDYKTAIKRNLNIELLDDVIRTLASGDILPSKYNDHALSGNRFAQRLILIIEPLLMQGLNNFVKKVDKKCTSPCYCTFDKSIFFFSLQFQQLIAYNP